MYTPVLLLDRLSIVLSQSRVRSLLLSSVRSRDRGLHTIAFSSPLSTLGVPAPPHLFVARRSIDPRARVTNSRRAAIRALPCLGNEKTIDSIVLRPRGRA